MLIVRVKRCDRERTGCSNLCSSVFFLAMYFRGYEDLRPFGCFTLMEIGFMSLYSNFAIGRRERAALRAASHLRLSEAQAAVSAVVSRCEGWSLMDRSAVLAGRDMCSAVEAITAAVAECTMLSQRVSRPLLIPRPSVEVCRPLLASESAYLALTLCVLPKHCGYLESYEMDHGVRLVKAGLMVAEYEGFASRVEYWHGDPVPDYVMTMIRNLRCSVLARLRRLSLSFVPIGSRGVRFVDILEDIKGMCQDGDSCYLAARLDPRRPRAIEYLYADDDVVLVLQP